MSEFNETLLEPDYPEVVGTAKAARLLGFSEETIRRWCREGKLEGAFQPSGYDGKWLIPMKRLERIRGRSAVL